VIAIDHGEDTTMKRLIYSIGLWIALALPGASFAQGFAGQGPNQLENQAIGTSASGMIRGIAEGIDLPDGVLFVRTSFDVVALHATPAQLAGINPGDLVYFPYRDYLGALWLPRRVDGTGGSFYGVYANEGQFTGAVTGLNKAAGVIVINGVPFRAHPGDLQQIVPGAFVTARFVSIGPVNWLSGIAPASERFVH
jgi:hypothetical protein